MLRLPFSHNVKQKIHSTFSLFSNFSGDTDVVFCEKTLETTYAAAKEEGFINWEQNQFREGIAKH